MLRRSLVVLSLAVSSGCGPTPSLPEIDAGIERSADTDAGLLERDGGGRVERCGAFGHDLPRLHPADPERAERGRRALTEDGGIARGILPRLALENLWLVWGTAPMSGDTYWSALRERYGFVEAPFENDGLPMGLRDTGDGLVAFECLACHGGVVAGRTLIGAPNTRLDLESLYDDLVALNELAPRFGYPSVAIPFDLDGFTIAAGSMDAFGLAMELASGGAPGSVETEYGAQRASAWWTVAHEDVLYSDGIGAADGHRTMMATMLAFGVTESELRALEPMIEDVGHFIRSIEAPCWDLSTIDRGASDRGRAIFDRECASCHGVHDGEGAMHPSAIIDLATVGTDPMRSERWTEREAAAVNATFFGVPPMRDTAGYHAPSLVGIWARAPYFHNGAVPDLASVLDPASRPARWRRTGSAEGDYDVDRVGWRYAPVDGAPDPDTREGRLVVDTARPGLGADGHPFGSALAEDERRDLLEYLKTL
jgi:mono/diheme cytochrome c family protein